MTARTKAGGAAKASASYPAIEMACGRPIADWAAIIRVASGRRHGELVSMLKAEHGMGHGHANALVAHTLAADPS